MQSILALSLGVKGGSIIYGAEIIERFSIPCNAIIAKDAVAKPSINCTQWTAHKSSLEFLIYSFLLLPFYLTKIAIDLIQNRYSALYLPYLHFWSIFFILLFKLFRKKVIITVHDGVLHNKNKSVPGIQYLTNSCIKLADELIFLSEYVLLGVKKELAPSGNYHVIPHGLIIPQNLKCSPKNYSKKPKLLFFGKVLASKGIENLIDACQKIAPERFDRLQIVGKHFYPLNIDKNANNADKIEIIDEFIAEANIAKYFNQADILVLPYTEASQSGVATIGIAACLPTVCTKVGGLKEQFVANTENLEAIFVDSNSQQIQSGILKLIDSQDKYETISRNLKKKHLSLQWKNISSQIQKVIEDSIE